MQDNLMQMRQQFQPPAPAPQNPVAQGGVQWVNGEQEARNWMIAPNAAVALWDSTAPTVYLKQADASGKPSLKIYDLVERTSNPATQTAASESNSMAALKSEVEQLKSELGELKEKMLSFNKSEK